MPRTLDDVAAIVARENGLATVVTARRDGTTPVTLVNAGVMAHPISGEGVVGLVAIGGSVKLTHLRRNPATSVTWRVGWEWLTVEGLADLIGPDDLPDGFAAERVAHVLRGVFVAAGGTHDDWETYDRVMAEERRTAVFVTPTRIYGVYRG